MRLPTTSTLALLLARIAIIILFALPLLWMLATAARPESQLGDPALLPQPIHAVPRFAAENMQAVLTDDVVQFPVYLRNSLYVAVLSVTGTVAASAIVAYGFARVRWRGRRVVFGLMLATMMIPFPVIMVPLYLIFREVGWIGSFKPLWIPAWFGNAFSIFLLRQFFVGIPRELD
ncbi:MAG: carbohydrate ABC transporter permease, partial [Planctomycetota bacterium]